MDRRIPTFQKLNEIENLVYSELERKCAKCDKRGLNHCEICGSIFCNNHSAYLERGEEEDEADQKCLYCYEASLTDNNSFY
jgi:hypothetical protein